MTIPYLTAEPCIDPLTGGPATAYHLGGEGNPIVFVPTPESEAAAIPAAPLDCCAEAISTRQGCLGCGRIKTETVAIVFLDHSQALGLTSCGKTMSVPNTR